VLLEYIGGATPDSSWNGFAGMWAIVAGSVTTIATGAVIAAIYRNNAIDVALALKTGLRKLPAAIGAGFLIAVGCGVPVGLVVLLAIGMGAFRYPNPFSVIMGVVMIAAMAVWVLCMAIAGMYVLTSMGIDRLGVADSIGKAGSLFTDAGFGRALVFGVALCVILLGASALDEAAVYAFQTYLHNIFLSYGFDAVLSFISSPLADVLVAVFYFDTAIRREGYDMQVALDAMPG
jgi:hypothetical protein